MVIGTRSGRERTRNKGQTLSDNVMRRDPLNKARPRGAACSPLVVLWSSGSVQSPVLHSKITMFRITWACRRLPDAIHKNVTSNGCCEPQSGHAIAINGN